jgi:uncharacterized protein (DUF924 family)
MRRCGCGSKRCITPPRAAIIQIGPRPPKARSRSSCCSIIPRNLYRGSAHAFATDPMARWLARQMLDDGHDRAVERALRSFCYMPFMHSEDLADQDLSVRLFQLQDADGPDLSQLQYAEDHRDIIRRFGRFPHRNLALGRVTTPEERAFLDEGGFAG